MVFSFRFVIFSTSFIHYPQFGNAVKHFPYKFTPGKFTPGWLNIGNSSASAIRKVALTRFPPLRGYLWNKAERRFLLIIGRSLSREQPAKIRASTIFAVHSRLAELLRTLKKALLAAGPSC
ncbi:MAG: hypothetical protein Q4C65_09860 [Eubacteriales bacterium]|nr:hypothetical protein [Eubacteriales bacterium]